MRETGPNGFTPERAAEAGDTQKLLIEHWQQHGNLDAPGVSDDEKKRFAHEQAALYDREIQKLVDKIAEQEREKAGWLKQAALVEGRGAAKAAPEPFAPEELDWFKEGEDENRMTLQESWEALGSLDVDDIPDAEKLDFARKKKAQYDAALQAGRLKTDDAMIEKMRRLDILISQYGAEKKD